MDINRKNYENIFLSYIEKRLQPGEVADLLIFLEQNPDLKAELEGIENVTLNPSDHVTFTSKNSLKKRDYTSTENINPWNYEEKMIALLEGDLSASGIRELKQFMRLNHPQSNLELNLFKQVVLIPDKIAYPDKNQLKKGDFILPFRTRFMYASSVAALLALLIGLYFLVSRQNTSSTLPLEKITETPSQQEQNLTMTFPEEVIEDVETIIQPHYNVIEKKAETPEFFNAEPIITIEMRHWDNNLATVRVNSSIEYRNLVSDYNLIDVKSIDGARPSFAGRFIRGVTSKVIGQPDLKNRSFVEMTIDGYNLLADRQVEVDKKLDEQGNVIAYNIRGETISFSRSVGKSQKSP